MSNHTMIPVIISGLSPESYQRKLNKKSESKNMPLRTSKRIKSRKSKISKRKIVQKQPEST